MPLFMNFGFSLTDGASINFSSRDYSGLDNLARIVSETQIDVGIQNMEDDKFMAAAADTFIFVVFQVPIMILIALFTAVVSEQGNCWQGLLEGGILLSCNAKSSCSCFFVDFDSQEAGAFVSNTY